MLYQLGHDISIATCANISRSNKTKAKEIPLATDIQACRQVEVSVTWSQRYPHDYPRELICTVTPLMFRLRIKPQHIKVPIFHHALQDHF